MLFTVINQPLIYFVGKHQSIILQQASRASSVSTLSERTPPVGLFGVIITMAFVLSVMLFFISSRSIW